MHGGSPLDLVRTPRHRRPRRRAGPGGRCARWAARSGDRPRRPLGHRHRDRSGPPTAIVRLRLGRRHGSVRRRASRTDRARAGGRPSRRRGRPTVCGPSSRLPRIPTPTGGHRPVGWPRTSQPSQGLRARGRSPVERVDDPRSATSLLPAAWPRCGPWSWGPGSWRRWWCSPRTAGGSPAPSPFDPHRRPRPCPRPCRRRRPRRCRGVWELLADRRHRRRPVRRSWRSTGGRSESTARDGWSGGSATSCWWGTGAARERLGPPGSGPRPVRCSCTRCRRAVGIPSSSGPSACQGRSA